ncbi:MAG: hypothetical protein NVS4B8_10350 [Herpetosiphon sp.]
MVNRRSVWIPLIYLGTALLFFLPALILQRIPLPLENAYTFADPLWKQHAPKQLSSPANFTLVDLTNYYYPYMVTVVPELQQGHVPLWNPLIFSGMPLMGVHQPAVLYPLNILFAWLGPHWIWIATAIVRFWLMGWGLHLFVRQLGVRNSAALWAGLSYQFGAGSVTWLHFPVHNVLAFLPLALFAADRLIKEPRGRWFLLLTACLACQFLGGHPETSVLFALVWGSWAAVRIPWRRAWPSVGLFGASAVAAIGLTLPQSLPTVGLLQASGTLIRRSHGGGTVGSWSSLKAWLLVINPYLFGTPLGNRYWGNASTNYNEWAIYVGFLTMPWVITAVVVARQRRLVAFWGGIGLLSLILRFPLPVLHVIDAVPLLSVGRGIRFNLSWSLAASVLAALGVEEVLSGSRRGRWIVAGTASVCLGLLLWSIFDVAKGAHGSFILGREARSQLVRKLGDFYRRSNLQLELLLATATIGTGLALALLRPSLGRYVPGAMLACLLLDLLSHGVPYNGFAAPQAAYPLTPLTSALRQQHGHFRIASLNGIMVGNTSMTQGLENAQGEDDLASFRYEQFASRGSKIGLRDGIFEIQEPAQRFFDLANVEYLFSTRAVRGPAGHGWSIWSADGPVKVYRNEDVLPRVFAVHKARVVGAQQAIPAVYEPTFEPRREAIVEEEIPELTTGAAQAGEQENGAAITISQYLPEEVRIEAEVARTSLVVLSDSYDVDWQVTVDGRTQHLYRVNGVYRGVVVPAGKHQIAMQYRPKQVVLGSVVALLVLGLCVGGAGWFHRRRLTNEGGTKAALGA